MPQLADANLVTPNQTKMILTNCAACAAPLAHDAPRCVRCKTRYRPHLGFVVFTRGPFFVAPKAPARSSKKL